MGPRPGKMFRAISVRRKVQIREFSSVRRRRLRRPRGGARVVGGRGGRNPPGNRSLIHVRFYGAFPLRRPYGSCGAGLEMK